MTLFWLVATAIALVAVGFVLFAPKQRREIGQDITASSRQWYRQRERELIEGVAESADADHLIADARLRVMEDTPQCHASKGEYRTQWRSWPVALMVLLGAGLLYWQLGSAPDVVIAQRLAALKQGGANPQGLQEIVEIVERRARQRPGNMQYASLLAQYYMGQQRYADAAARYRLMLEQSPDDATLLAYAAQSDYLASQRKLSTQAQRWLDQAIVLNPRERTALGLLGMVAFEQGQFVKARSYWQTLLSFEQPDSPDAVMLREMVDMANARLGAPDTDNTAASDGADSVNQGAGVVVKLSIPQGAIAPSDSVFVLVRPADVDTRMPLAVRRFSGADLPELIVLDNRHSMAGQSMLEGQKLSVVVQVSPSGRPGVDNATWQGLLSPVLASLTPEPETVELINHKQ